MARTPGGTMEWNRGRGTKWSWTKPNVISLDPWKIVMLMLTLYFLFTSNYTHALWTLALYSFFGFKLTFRY